MCIDIQGKQVMKDRILALIDPAGRLRSASSLLRSRQVHEYSSIEGLLGSRRQVSSSLCIVLDADLLRLCLLYTSDAADDS